MEKSIYEPITPGLIRLLLILPGESDEEVRCVLETVPLSLFNAPSRSLANYTQDKCDIKAKSKYSTIPTPFMVYLFQEEAH